MPDLPLIPAAQLGLLVVVLVVVVPVAAMALAMMNARAAAEPTASTTDFWSALLAEQRERGAILGTPAVAPVVAAPRPGRHRRSSDSVAVSPAIADATPQRTGLVAVPGTAASRLPYRPDMTLRELRQATMARVMERDWQRLEFRWEMGRPARQRVAA